MSLRRKILLTLLSNVFLTTALILLVVAYLFNQHLNHYSKEEYNKIYQAYIKVLELKMKGLQNMEKAYISIRIGNRCETTKGYFLTLPSGTV